MGKNNASSALKTTSSLKKGMRRLTRYLKKNKLVYLLLMPPLICWLLFKVGPLFGMVIAFQEYSPFKGITGSKFIGLSNFMRIFREPYMLTLVRNTVLLALYTLVFTFTVPVVFALFLNEIRISWIKKRSAVRQLSALLYLLSGYGKYSLYHGVSYHRNCKPDFKASWNGLCLLYVRAWVVPASVYHSADMADLRVLRDYLQRLYFGD